MAKHTVPPLPLPKHWPQKVRSAAVHAIALARLALTTARGQTNSANPGSRRIARLTEELFLIKEEMRIKDARMASIPAQRRPHYLPTERLAIVELRAARGWSQAQAADRLLITPATIASWMSRLDEEGPAALVQMREPVNRFPDFVAHVVRKLKVLCPTMGKVRIAQFLARAGLHLGSTTVARMLAAPWKGGKRELFRFEFDDTGKPLYLLRVLYGWHYDFDRRPDGPPPGPDMDSWAAYFGNYEIKLAGIVLEVAEVKVENGYLEFGGTRMVEEFLPGLFFSVKGEALDLRGEIPTWRNIPMRKVD